MSLKAGGQERVEIGQSAAGVNTLTYGVEGGRMTVEFPAAAMIGYGSGATAAITGMSWGLDDAIHMHRLSCECYARLPLTPIHGVLGCRDHRHKHAGFQR